MLYKDTVESPAGNEAYWDPEAAAYYDPVADEYFGQDDTYDSSHLFEEDLTEEELQQVIEDEAEREMEADIESENGGK